MKSGTKFIFTILHLAICAQTFAKYLDSNESDESDFTFTERPPPTEPLNAYKPEIANYTDISYITTIYASKHFNKCPGTIIARRFIVTAADCVDEYKAENLFVKDILNEAYIIVKSIIFSQVYSEKDQLAVLELQRPLNVQAEPISLISKDELERAIEAEINVIAVGFQSVGFQNTYGPFVAKLKLYPEEKCIENYRQMLTEADKYDFEEALHFCFYPMKTGFVSKFNGGALVINGKLAGIKIHNRPYTNNSLYSKVTNFEGFLNQFIGEEEITTPDSTEVSEHPDSYECPEVSGIIEKLEQLFKGLFEILIANLNQYVKNSNMTADQNIPPRVSSRNLYFQSASESILEFEFFVQSGPSEEGIQEIWTEHVSSYPNFFIKMTEDRLYLKVVKDNSLSDPIFWIRPIKVNITYKFDDGAVQTFEEDVIPIHLFNFIATVLYVSTIDFLPGFTNSVYDHPLIDSSKSLYLNFYVNLGFTFTFE